MCLCVPTVSLLLLHAGPPSVPMDPPRVTSVTTSTATGGLAGDDEGAAPLTLWVRAVSWTEPEVGEHDAPVTCVRCAGYWLVYAMLICCCGADPTWLGGDMLMAARTTALIHKCVRQAPPLALLWVSGRPSFDALAGCRTGYIFTRAHGPCPWTPVCGASLQRWCTWEIMSVRCRCS